MPQMVMGRLPQLFPEPDQFLPERWSRDKENTPNMFASLPFGFGSRMCPGEFIFCDLDYLCNRIKVTEDFFIL